MTEHPEVAPVIAEGWDTPGGWRLRAWLHQRHVMLELGLLEEPGSVVSLGTPMRDQHEAIRHVWVLKWPLGLEPMPARTLGVGPVAKSVASIVARLSTGEEVVGSVAQAPNLPINIFVVFAPLESSIDSIEARDEGGQRLGRAEIRTLSTPPPPESSR